MARVCDKCQRSFRSNVGLNSHYCSPKDPNRAKIFSDEWEKANPCMRDANENHSEPDEEHSFGKTMGELQSALEKIKKSEPKRVGICINFNGGIPLEHFEQEETEKVRILERKANDLAIFNEMMGESRGISRVVRSMEK